jgi:histidine ammonia-lyase
MRECCIVQPPLVLDGSSLSLEELSDVAFRGRSAILEGGAVAHVDAARAVIDRAVAEDRVVYGVTTGFGKFADVVIPREKLGALQLNLVRSHAAGVGAPLARPAVRAVMLLRANCLAKGFSGIRRQTLELLLACLAKGIHPVVPEQGSVGASGDLAPLAHLALALVGEGEVDWNGRRLPSGEALRAAGLSPAVLEAKEGLALINGTQLTTAIGALGLHRFLRLLKAADLVAALTLDTLKGTDTAFDPRIHAARPHPGQIESARNLRMLLASSALRESHRDCGVVQDAYALRCIPQVHGTARDAAAHARRVIEIEMNAATDNPMVFAETGTLVSGGNFHAAPVALVCDLLTAAAADMASLSERRTERMVNPALSGDLPAFLTPGGGLNSGLMMIHVTAAALVSEAKSNSFPASVDSIPTSAGKEDHVSMGPIAARKFAKNVDLFETVLAIELLAAAQALDFRRPLTTSAPLEELHRLVRARVPFWDSDRQAAPAIEGAREVLSGDLDAVLAPLV